MAKEEAIVQAGTARAAASGALWVGEHASDGDLLVFDPAVAGNDPSRRSYFSLTQLRWRVFPAGIADRKIVEVTDEVRAARARKEYARREELRAERASEEEAARAETAERQREQVIQLHERYIERMGLEYAGVQDSAGRPRSRRSKCHACGFALDDFVGRVCATCEDVLCSCGACACGRPRSR